MAMEYSLAFYEFLGNLPPALLWIVSLVIVLILGEIIFTKLIKTIKFSRKQAKSQSERWVCTILMKILSILCGSALLYLLLFLPALVETLITGLVIIISLLITGLLILGFWIIENWQNILIGLGVAAIVFVWLYLNKKYADKHIKVMTAAEEKARDKKRIDNKNKSCKFKIGEKVRVKKWPFRTNLSWKKEYAGKIVTIYEHRGYSFRYGQRFYIEEDGQDAFWVEDQVEKIKHKRKNKK